nr:helix-turn-helix domain-containing protein [Candidatus Omnitrophota bacterium]
MINKDVITIPGLAKLLGISRIAVFRKVKRGEIQAEKIGKTYIIPLKSLSLALGRTISKEQKESVGLAVKKAVSEYGEALKMLGNE